ncbi:phosphatase [uncultured Mitsuokella sp.]|uniref:phosphatase n=1 Tax=uncultured Mitsuokella sp. TaxID=453120 RepID=UPI0025D4FFD2|nr:phosphatase [uncultured Mitsuokella sp.]
MKDLLDVHMHTLASGHAYNTIREMIAAGKKNGMQLVGIADHAPAMPSSTHRFYFENLRIFDRKAYGDEAGVELLMGVELNILNTTGKVDLGEKALRSVDYAIASLHDPCINPGSVLDNTTAIMSAMFIPQVKIIGHPDNPTFPVDFDQIAKAAKERHVLLECNNSSYRPGGSREGSRELAKKMLQACKKYGTHVIMGSDAHIDLDVGNHLNSQQVLAAADFPEELVINGSPEAFKEWIRE